MSNNFLEKILVLGGSGMLGSSLIPILKNKGRQIEVHGRANAIKYNADISDAKELFKLLDLINPTVIVNLVGLTNVDSCEEKPHDAFLANVKVVENIADWMKQASFPSYLIHISTDQVYDGVKLHNEADITLTNYYAFSKYTGELAAIGVPSAIIRTNFFGRSNCAKRISFTDWIFRSIESGEVIQVFDDVLFSPLSMSTLSDMIDLVIQRKPTGIFNLGSNSGMSKADFAFAFADELNLSTNTMVRSATEKVTFLKTYRPKDMRMDCSKFESILEVKLPNLRNEIQLAAKDYYEST